MEFLKNAWHNIAQSNFYLNILSVICAIGVFVCQFLVRGVIINLQPKTLFKKSIFRRVNPILYVTLFFICLAGYFSYLKDQNSDLQVRCAQKDYRNIIDAVKNTGYQYRSGNDTLKKLITASATQLSATRNPSDLNPHISNKSIFPILKDTSHNIKTTLFRFAVSCEIYNSGPGIAKNVKCYSILIFNLRDKNEYVNFVDSPNSEILPNQGITTYSADDRFKRYPTNGDTLYLRQDIFYTNTKGKKMPTVTYYYYCFSENSLQWMEVPISLHKQIDTYPRKYKI